MREYLAKRIIIAFIVLFIVASLNFTMFQVMWAGDPTALILDPEFTYEQRQMLLRQFGLLDPLHVRYIKYVRNMFTWTFGVSFQSRTPVAQELSWRLPNTILLLGTATIGTIILGIATNPIIYMADVAWHLAQPALSLIVAAFGGWALYVRNLMIDSLTQDYIVTARAKGVSERTLLYRHAFRSILPPISTIITLSIPGIVTGAMITEYIFTWPGIGSWYIAALNSNDYPVVQAVLFIYAVLVILCNFIADLLYGVLDPRIRVGVRR